MTNMILVTFTNLQIAYVSYNLVYNNTNYKYIYIFLLDAVMGTKLKYRST